MNSRHRNTSSIDDIHVPVQDMVHEQPLHLHHLGSRQHTTAEADPCPLNPLPTTSFRTRHASGAGASVAGGSVRPTLHVKRHAMSPPAVSPVVREDPCTRLESAPADVIAVSTLLQLSQRERTEAGEANTAHLSGCNSAEKNRRRDALGGGVLSARQPSLVTKLPACVPSRSVATVPKRIPREASRDMTHEHGRRPAQLRKHPNSRGRVEYYGAPVRLPSCTGVP